MGGIYIHIPYCRKACTYCNFHFSTSMSTRPEFIKSLIKEIESRPPYFKEVESIYFGGGTPSVLTGNELNDVLASLAMFYSWDKTAEITFEVNPDDISKEYVTMIRDAGINRLSIGVQSFFDEDLQFMNRSHNAGQSKTAIALAKDAGIEQISIDLIYGIPGASHEKWEENIDTFLQLNVDHLSAYCLTVEEKTALHKLVQKGKVSFDDQHSYEQFSILINKLMLNGYEQYEVSNFCRNGKIAKHNSSYWQSKPYMGFGPSAHSFNGLSRSWNVANNVKYIKTVNDGEPYFEEEMLSLADRYNEYIMTGLRTKWGVTRSEISKVFGEDYLAFFEKELLHNRFKDFIQDEDGMITVNTAGKFYSDAIASSFFKIQSND